MGHKVLGFQTKIIRNVIIPLFKKWSVGTWTWTWLNLQNWGFDLDLNSRFWQRLGPNTRDWILDLLCSICNLTSRTWDSDRLEIWFGLLDFTWTRPRGVGTYLRPALTDSWLVLGLASSTWDLIWDLLQQILEFICRVTWTSVLETWLGLGLGLWYLRFDLGFGLIDLRLDLDLKSSRGLKQWIWDLTWDKLKACLDLALRSLLGLGLKVLGLTWNLLWNSCDLTWT